MDLSGFHFMVYSRSMDFAAGDWVQLIDAPSMFAEVINVNICENGLQPSVFTLFIVGDCVPSTFSLSEARRWEPFDQKAAGEVPSWVRLGEFFVHRFVSSDEARVVVRSTKQGWLSFFHVAPRPIGFYDYGSFDMARWEDFIEKWVPEQLPTSWDHLMDDLENADAAR